MDPNGVLLLRVVLALSLACLGLLTLLTITGKRQLTKILDAVERVPSREEQTTHREKHERLDVVMAEHNWLKKSSGCALSHREN